MSQFWALLFEIVSDMEKRLFAHLAVHGLTPPQFYVLKTLIEHEGRCRIGQIAEEHHLTSATMTGLIKRLESMTPPLVCREPGAADRRVVEVRLTPAGEERFYAVQAGILQQIHLALGLLPAEERRQIIDRVRFYFRVLRQWLPAG
jgi:DNA-binding MarR family transcriptional regulator